MHVLVLFYSDTVVMAQQAGGIKGRAVANHGFLEALIQNQLGIRVSLVVSSNAEKQFVSDYFKHPPTIVSFQELAGFLKENPIDVVHTLGPTLYRALYVKNSIVSGSVVTTGMTHSLGHEPFLDWLCLNYLAAPTKTDVLVCTTPTAKQVIGQMSQAIPETIKQKGELECEVIPLGLDYPSFQKTSDSIKPKLGIGKEDMMLLSLCRFSYYTKLDLIPLVLIFKQLQARVDQKVKLVLAGAQGNENYPAFLKEVLDDHGLSQDVLIIPDPDEAAKKSLYDSADIFVALGDNVQETFGLTVIEALASGLPVVASDWNGYRALVKDGQTGFLVPTLHLGESPIPDRIAPLQLDSLNHLFLSQAVATNESIFVDRLVELIEDSEKRQLFSKNAQESAAQYDWSCIVQQYHDLWQKLLNQDQANSDSEQPTLNYHQVFSHYASQTLDDKMKFKITERGSLVLKGKFPLRLYPGIEEVLSVDQMAQILNKLGSPLSVSEINQSFSSPHLAQYHVMWLYKYGLIQSC